MTDERGGGSAAPPRYKLAVVSWLGAYPVITLILGALGPAMEGWPLPLRTLVISGLMVAALTWVVTRSSIASSEAGSFVPANAAYCCHRYPGGFVGGTRRREAS